MSSEHVLNLREFEGGSAAIWGAVSPVFDSTGWPTIQGVHVHARKIAGGTKQVDETYSKVTLKNWRQGERPITITATDAIHYMVASVFGLNVKSVHCPRCKLPHLDEGWFSVNPHQKHLCSNCNGVFFDTERGIGNPLAEIANAASAEATQLAEGLPRELQQMDYPSGMQLWGSNPAIFTMNQRREQRGVHVHAFGVDGKTLIDDTVPSLAVDGIHLDAEMVRSYMAQSTVPHLKESIQDIICPRCGGHHFDQGVQAHIPHLNHCCEHCGSSIEFSDGKECIGNPLVGTLAHLKQTTLKT